MYAHTAAGAVDLGCIFLVCRIFTVSMNEGIEGWPELCTRYVCLGWQTLLGWVWVWMQKQKRKEKRIDSAGSGDTASMIKRGKSSKACVSHYSVGRGSSVMEDP